MSIDFHPTAPRPVEETEPLRDSRVRSNEAYLIVILLSRVITRLGTVPDVNPGVIESLFASDLAFLQDLYRAINFGDRPMPGQAERNGGPVEVMASGGV